VGTANNVKCKFTPSIVLHNHQLPFRTLDPLLLLLILHPCCCAKQPPAVLWATPKAPFGPTDLSLSQQLHTKWPYFGAIASVVVVVHDYCRYCQVREREGERLEKRVRERERERGRSSLWPELKC